MDYSEVKKVIELTDAEQVQDYLDTGLWVILSIAAGQDDNNSAYHLYALGSNSSETKELPLRGKGITYI